MSGSVTLGHLRPGLDTLGQVSIGSIRLWNFMPGKATLGQARQG